MDTCEGNTTHLVIKYPTNYHTTFFMVVMRASTLWHTQHLQIQSFASISALECFFGGSECLASKYPIKNTERYLTYSSIQYIYIYIILYSNIVLYIASRARFLGKILQSDDQMCNGSSTFLCPHPFTRLMEEALVWHCCLREGCQNDFRSRRKDTSIALHNDTNETYKNQNMCLK